jgi:hypothetical protein
MNGGVEHAADVGARNGAAMHADADKATRERGQPNRGLRDLNSTIARMTASSGPFGPGFLGHGDDENGRRYFRCTKA